MPERISSSAENKDISKEKTSSLSNETYVNTLHQRLTNIHIQELNDTIEEQKTSESNQEKIPRISQEKADESIIAQ